MDVDFFGIPSYAATMTFELFTNDSSVSTFPPIDDLNMRFLFNNGTEAADSNPIAFPLFGQSSTVLSWSSFEASMEEFAVTTQSQLCSLCGDTTGACATGAST